MNQCSGAEVFKLMDTHGLPLEIINQMLREKETFFSVPEFITAAKSGGWPDKRIMHTLIGASPLTGQPMAELILKISLILYPPPPIPFP